jgi:hypothetical protein
VKAKAKKARMTKARMKKAIMTKARIRKIKMDVEDPEKRIKKKQSFRPKNPIGTLTRFRKISFACSLIMLELLILL